MNKRKLEKIITKSCLVGNTGFVGGNLINQYDFSIHYNRSNISDIVDQEFDILVCAAAPGSMFEVNKSPQQDLINIETLIGHFLQSHPKKFVLISTIAVLAELDAGYSEKTAQFEKDLPYGSNRRVLENFVESSFKDSLIVRLPALYGNGLRKNFIFDILNPVPTLLSEDKLEEVVYVLPNDLGSVLRNFYSHDKTTGMLKINRAQFDARPERSQIDATIVDNGLSALNFHHPDTTFQYYDLSRLWSDISLAINQGLNLIHLSPEPLKASTIYNHLTGKIMPKTNARLHHEDMHTLHSSLWEREGPYIESKDSILNSISSFYKIQKESI